MELSFLKNAKVVGADDEKQKAEAKQEVNQEATTEAETENQEPQNENEVEQVKEEENNKDNKDEKEELQQGQEEVQSNEKQEQEVQEVNLDDDKVLSYLKEKGIEVDGFEDLTKPKEKTEIPQELQSYLEYKKETNRSYKDFLELQKDWSKESEDVALERYLKEKNPYFTDEDVKDELADFGIDEDIDTEAEIRKKKRNKRKLLSEAVSYLEGQKEKYKSPLEGSSSAEVQIPDDYKEAKTKLSEMQKLQEQQSEVLKQRQQNFLENTKSVFNQDFKGFEFEVAGQKKVFKSDESNALLDMQSDINKFISKFTGDNGELKDVKGYHKALNAAMNADKLAKHFYELGKSEAIAEETRESKNINFSGHKTADNSTSKPKWKVVTPMQQGLKIRN